MKKILLTFLGLVAVSLTVNADIITQWNFDAGNLTPSTGTGTATLGTLGTESFPVGNGSAAAWSSTNWDVADYFQFQVSTTGFEDITLSWDQTGSNTGPANFNLQYSTDGVNYLTFGAIATITNDSWSSLPANFRPASVRTADLSAISTIENATIVYFRITDSSTTAINGGTVATTGTGRIDNFTVSGAAIPEPTSAALLFGGLGLMVWTLRQRRASVQA